MCTFPSRRNWIWENRPLEPVLGKRFHAEAEFDVKDSKFLPTGAEFSEHNEKVDVLIRTLTFGVF